MPGKRAEGKVSLGWWTFRSTRDRLKRAAARRGITVTDALDEAACRWLSENEGDAAAFAVPRQDETHAKGETQ
jgi:hypothetical protein